MPITSEMHAPAGAIGISERLNCPPDAKFVLMAHPASGAVQTEGLDKPTWLPELTAFRLIPGVQGVKTLERGEQEIDAYKEAVRELESSDVGWVVIPTNLPIPAEMSPTGHQLPSYMVEHDCFHRASGVEGKCYTEFYARRVPTRSTRDAVKWEYRTHHALRNRWILHLVETGVIPAPDEWCRNDRTADARKWRDQQATIDDPEKRKDFMSRADKALEQIETAVIPAEVIAASEPKPSRRRSAQ